MSRAKRDTAPLPADWSWDTHGEYRRRVDGLRLSLMKMSQVSDGAREILATLTIPEYWAMSRWLHQDGSCYVCIASDRHGRIIGWACLTFEDEPWPVLGAYVDERYRGQRVAEQMVGALLRHHAPAITRRGGVVYAAANLWPKYRELIEREGHEHREWAW